MGRKTLLLLQTESLPLDAAAKCVSVPTGKSMPTTLLSGRVDGRMVLTTATRSIQIDSEQLLALRKLHSLSLRKPSKLWALTQQHWVRSLTAKQSSRRLALGLKERKRTLVSAQSQSQTSRRGLTQCRVITPRGCGLAQGLCILERKYIYLVCFGAGMELNVCYLCCT